LVLAAGGDAGGTGGRVAQVTSSGMAIDQFDRRRLAGDGRSAPAMSAAEQDLTL
jgi:hypothetical protein